MQSDTEQIAAMLAGDLDPQQRAQIRQRLTATEAGRELLAELEAIVSFLRDEHGARPPQPLVDRIKAEFRRTRPGLAERIAGAVRTIVATLDFDSRLSPAVPGFRGAAEIAQVAFSAGDCEIDLEVRTEEGVSVVRGQIDADEADGWRVRPVRAEGADPDAAPVEIAAAVDGSFRARLGPGSYTLVLERGSVRIEAGPLVLP